MNTKQKLDGIADIWKSRAGELSSRRSFIGFDGFIDSIVRPVMEKDENGQNRYFREMSDLGHYIVSKQGRNSCIEIEELIVKTGGSAQIFATAIGTLGLRVDCVGAMGISEIHPVFESMKEANCTLHSYADPGYNTALEFDSGKFMMARMLDLNTVKWHQIKEKIGLERLVRMYRDSHLIGVVNWSEIYHSNTIWQGILDDLAPTVGPDRSKLMFIDLSDCSGRSRDHIRSAMGMIREFARYCRVAIGMNENEARVVYRALFDADSGPDLTAMGERLYPVLGADELLIHRSDYCTAWDRSGSCVVHNFYTDTPALSTGAGVNFNAGFCAGMQLGLEMESCLVLGHAVAGFYVRHGRSPTPDDVIRLLGQWGEFLES